VDGFALTDLTIRSVWCVHGFGFALIWSWVEGFAWSRSSRPFAWVVWVSDRIDLASWGGRILAWSAFIALSLGCVVSDRMIWHQWVEDLAWSAFHFRTVRLGALGFGCFDLASWLEGFAMGRVHRAFRLGGGWFRSFLGSSRMDLRFLRGLT